MDKGWFGGSCQRLRTWKTPGGLVAIDRGIEDVREGRVVSLEDARRFIDRLALKIIVIRGEGPRDFPRSDRLAHAIFRLRNEAKPAFYAEGPVLGSTSTRSDTSHWFMIVSSVHWESVD